MNKPYSGNGKPFVLALFAQEDREQVLPILEALEKKGLTLCGQDGKATDAQARKACTTVAFLSEHFAKDEQKQQVFFTADAARMPVIPVKLDNAKQPEVLERSITAKNAILAGRYSAEEVAERIVSGPGSKAYGAISLGVQYYAEPYLAANVPRNCFMPRPDVDSAVIRLTKRSEQPVRVQDPSLMFRLIRASFSVRRKTLMNGLRNAGDLGFSGEALEDAVRSLGKRLTVRGETLSLREFAALSDALSAMR